MNKRKNILFLVKSFSYDKNKWLTDELIVEFSKNNHCTVFCVDRKEQWETGCHSITENIDLIVFGVRNKRNPVKTFFDLFVHSRRFFWNNLSNKSFDVVIEFSVFSYFFGLSRKLLKQGKVKKSVGILWDFFPIHQVEIGKIPRFLSKVLYRTESKEVQAKDAVFLMSERNVDFFNKYFPEYKNYKNILHVWSDEKKKVSIEPSIVDANKLNLVYGGQIEKGRGIDHVVSVLAESPELNDTVSLYILGEGRYKKELIKKANELSNVHILPAKDRDKYLGFITACDVGVVATVPNVSVPSFPSKVLDYIYSSKVVLAVVENSTDFGSYIQERIRCGLSVEAGNKENLLSAIQVLLSLKFDRPNEFKLMCENGKNFFSKEMTTNVAVRKISSFINE